MNANRGTGASVFPPEKQGVGTSSWGLRGSLQLFPTVLPTVLGVSKTTNDPLPKTQQRHIWKHENMKQEVRAEQTGEGIGGEKERNL